MADHKESLSQEIDHLRGLLCRATIYLEELCEPSEDGPVCELMEDIDKAVPSKWALEYGAGLHRVEWVRPS